MFLGRYQVASWAFKTRILYQKSGTRFASSASEFSGNNRFKIVVLGAGSGGLTVANQIYERFKAAGKQLNEGDIALVDAAEYHYYQPGWTLAGAGLKPKSNTRRLLASLIPQYISHIPENVQSFSPESSSITTTSGRSISYDALVVAAGIQINWDDIKGLKAALTNPSSCVSSVYSYDTCDKVWQDIEGLKAGNAVFAQPAGIIKCPGAPQKIMWMAWDRYRRTNRSGAINVNLYTGLPTMFAVKKYSEALEALRVERGVGGFFQHDLTAIDADNHKAIFKKADGSTTIVDYTLLHVTPPMGPLDFIKGSPIADNAGWVDVDPSTLRHVRPEFGNVFALGDCSSLPTSRTMAAITAQAPVLTENLFSVMDIGKVSSSASYNGYTSCPLLTGYGELMLTEFIYGLEPKESFSSYFGDQSKSNRLYYHLKKDFFPWVYWNSMVKGKWFGASGFIRPSF